VKSKEVIKEVYEVAVDGETFTVEVVESEQTGCCGTRGQCPRGFSVTIPCTESVIHKNE
jgi:hypothetical protein